MTDVRTERELHSTHEMVVGLHARFDNLVNRIEQLHAEHAELRDRVSSLDGRMSTVETVATLHQTANLEARAQLQAVVKTIEGRLDRLMVGVVVTLVSALGGTVTLIYQYLAN